MDVLLLSRKIDRLEKWANRSCVKGHKGKCKALPLGRGCWGCRRGAEGLVDHKLVMS